MTGAEAADIVYHLKHGRFRNLTYDRVEVTADTNGFEVWASYDGPKMVYQEVSGRQHRLRPGMLKIDSVAEWNAIVAILTKGINTEV